ncbi:tetratricopeptide repeat protein, partial [Streptomyces sp. SID5926]|nr:tetratricopeptide repeat protein [Streptomyces sp. SID5926]
IIEDTLTRRRRTLGDDHPDTLHSAQNVAIALYNLRQFAAAAQLFEDVRNRRRRTLGDNHPDTVDATRDLANALTALGRPFEAQRLLGPQKQQKKSRFRRKRK